MPQSYKTLKEDFVSNLSGGTVFEINWVTAVAPVSLPPCNKYNTINTKFAGRISTMGSPPVAPRLLLKVRSASFPCRLPPQRGRNTAGHHNVLRKRCPSQRSSGVPCGPPLCLTLRNRLPQEIIETSCKQARRIYNRREARAAANPTFYHYIQRSYDSGNMFGNTCGGL